VCRSFNTPKIEKVINEELLKIIPLSKALKNHEFGLPHRLDKSTQGLMIITKNDNYYDKLLKDFNNRLIKKQYLAYYEDQEIQLKDFQYFICDHGYINFSIYQDNCICEINNLEDVSINFIEKKDKVEIHTQTLGKKSTNYGRDFFNKISKEEEIYGIMKTKIKKHDGFIECFPITGIRHQIRLTMKYLNFPIINDNLYGSKKQNGNLGLYSVFIGIPLNNN
jgi:23S rRNA pseudouridine1911/1915/1917 synthase